MRVLNWYKVGFCNTDKGAIKCYLWKHEWNAGQGEHNWAKLGSKGCEARSRVRTRRQRSQDLEVCMIEGKGESKRTESKRWKLGFGAADLEEEPWPITMTKGEDRHGEIKVRITGDKKVKTLPHDSFFLGSMLVSTGSLVRNRVCH